jgi:hypothetical protein
MRKIMWLNVSPLMVSYKPQGQREITMAPLVDKHAFRHCFSNCRNKAEEQAL